MGEMNAIEVTHRNNRPLHPTAEQEDHSFDAVFNVMEELDHIEP